MLYIFTSEQKIRAAVQSSEQNVETLQKIYMTKSLISWEKILSSATKTTVDIMCVLCHHVSPS